MTNKDAVKELCDKILELVDMLADVELELFYDRLEAAYKLFGVKEITP